MRIGKGKVKKKRAEFLSICRAEKKSQIELFIIFEYF